jgi:hypothetical protein
MHDFQNKGLTKWAICKRLILKSLIFCGKVDTERCANWNNELFMETDTDTLREVWRNCYGVIYNNKYSTDKKNVKKKLGGRAFLARD